MAETTCPRCGFVQEGGEECLRCGIVFRRVHTKRQTPAPEPPAQRPELHSTHPASPPPEEASSSPGLVWRVYRVLRWVVLVFLIVVLALMLRQGAPPEVASDPAAAERAAAKMSAVGRALGVGAPYALTLDEAELNALLAENLALAPGAEEPALEEVRSNVRDLRVQLVGDRVVAWLLFDLHGKDLTLTIEARISAAGGRLQIEPVAGRLGTLPLPQVALERGVRRALEDPANADKLQLPPEIADIRVEDSRLVVEWRGASASPAF